MKLCFSFRFEIEVMEKKENLFEINRKAIMCSYFCNFFTFIFFKIDWLLENLLV